MVDAEHVSRKAPPLSWRPFWSKRKGPSPSRWQSMLFRFFGSAQIIYSENTISYLRYS